MDNTPRGRQKPKLECVFHCEDPKVFFRFPREEEPRKTWLNAIGLEVLPRPLDVARICSYHFSDRMFSEAGKGKRLTRCALPDRNIPGKPNVLPDPSIQVVRPRQVRTYVNLAEIPRIVHKTEIITSKSSKCFLKCRDAAITHCFPADKQARDVWAKQLGYNEMPRRSAGARICSNHFSMNMFSNSSHRRLTLCAIPDINLPGETVFISESELPGYVGPPEDALDGDSSGAAVSNMSFPETSENSPPNEQEINDLFQSALDAPIIFDETARQTQPEILINPIENIKSVVNLTSNKEGILHVFQPGIERKAEEMTDESRIALPENVVDADSECVLKCPHGERLFRFPRNEASRQLWLSKIGLTHCFFNTKICDRHFSEQMFINSKKRLVKNAYPDINIPPGVQPRIKDASKILTDFRITAENKTVCDVLELPEHICVLTVFKAHTEVDAVVNGVKYVRHKVDESIPKRDREVQVDMRDLIPTANVGISSDDYVDDFDIEDTTEYRQQDWMSMFKSHVFTSKGDMYECLICGEISVGYDCNVKHSHVHKESSSLCFHCGRVFSSKYKLKIHERNKHLNRLRKAMRCPKMHCNKAFHSKKQLTHHVDEHTRCTEHKCRKCLRGFTSFLKLHCHQVTCKNWWIPHKYPKRA